MKGKPQIMALVTESLLVLLAACGPDDVELTGECVSTEIAPQPLTFDGVTEHTPTGFDGINSATCRFSVPIAQVRVTLTGEGIGTHSETFFIEPASREVSFPVPDGTTPSERTLELLLPGDYQRQMVAATEDGRTWDIIANNSGAALDVVTVPGSRESGAGAPPTATPMPVREWEVEGIQVDGSVVTVDLRVYAGIDVLVVLDGRGTEEIVEAVPMLRYVFRDVPPGDHTIRISDVVGYVETVELTVR